MSSAPEDFASLFTDASFCPVYSVGGWACWAVCDGDRRKDAGPIRASVLNSRNAEMMALVNGVYRVTFWFPHLRHIHVVCDCVEVLEIMTGAQKKVRDRTMIECRKMIYDRVGDTTMSFKHVKAHQKRVEARQHVNGWCDRHAKKHMRALREKRKGKPIYLDK